MKKISLSDVQESTQKNIRTKAPSLLSLEHLADLCKKYSIQFETDPSKIKVDLIKVITVYKVIVKTLGGDLDQIEKIVKCYITIGRLARHYHSSFNPMLFDVFFVKENLDLYIKASDIILNSNNFIDWISLKRKLEERGENASFKGLERRKRGGVS